jgi:hypothetical protein
MTAQPPTHVRAADLQRGAHVALGTVREVVAWQTVDGLVLVDVYVRGSESPHTYGADALVEVRT